MAKYQLKEDGILLYNLPEEFVLEIKNKIHPEKNTSFIGLYKSNGNFCSQCEAQGFRKITYYLDRPDVLSVFTTTINANRKKYPVLLSNGNLIKDSNKSVIWHDPAPKPCYLFAIVAGNFKYLQDSYITKAGQTIDLRIYVEPHNIEKTKFAMQSLIRAFAWEEKRFNLSYDLDVYMIVAVDDFNMGAMENKGLNIFNSSCVLADEKTATDLDFISIESIIGHEYFHNWTGNRVTCRDWFQLSLKEGLTVFRDQEFSADMRSRLIQRIKDVVILKTYQFAEDSSPIKHPVRPDSYIEINNFYTATVYEKGAELIRMIHIIVGEQGFQKGMQLYFKRHDGTAVTIDDFVASMADANNYNFDHFMKWYSKAGTPEIEVCENYDKLSMTYTVRFKQKHPDKPFYIPNVFGLLDKNGKEIESGLVILDKTNKKLEFKNIKSKPVASWFRGFCAPIKLSTKSSFDDKLFLCMQDSDVFNRWDNAQKLWLDLILNPNKCNKDKLFASYDEIISNEDDYALLAEMLRLPSDSILHQNVSKIDVLDIHNKREDAIKDILLYLKPTFIKIYNKLNIYNKLDFSSKSIGKRSFKNLCLYYLAKDGEFELAFEQFNKANCMSDKVCAFQAILLANNIYLEETIESFYNQYKDDFQVMDKWFSYQSLSSTISIPKLKDLMNNKCFDIKNPNKVRALLGAFSKNHIKFHTEEGYKFITNKIIELDVLNPQIASGLVNSFSHWNKFSKNYSVMQKKQLELIFAIKNLSSDVYEVVNNALMKNE